MKAPVLQLSEEVREDRLARLNRSYFDRFTSRELAGCRDQLLSVLDERGRQVGLFDEPAALSPERAPHEMAPPQGPAGIDVAAHLSPSQLNTFVGDCQAKWYYRNVLKLADPKDASRALGSAVHAGIAENFRQKLETREDLDIAGVQAIARLNLEAELADAQLSATDNPADLRGLSDALVSLYMERVAPSIDPAAVELRVEGAIAGVHVSGYVDVLDTEGRVIDIKTASKKPAGVSPEYRRQLTTYALLAPGASGRGRLDTLTKTKTVALHQLTCDVTDADRRELERLYPLAQEAMRSGLYLPNRGSRLCGRYCPYREQCVADFGGEVSI